MRLALRLAALGLACLGLSGCFMTIPLATTVLDIGAKVIGADTAIAENLRLRKPPPPSWATVRPPG